MSKVLRGWGARGQNRPPFRRTCTHTRTNTRQLTIHHHGTYDLSHTHTVASKNSLCAVSLSLSTPSGRDAVFFFGFFSVSPLPPGSRSPLETAESNTRRRPLHSPANGTVKLIGLRLCECEGVSLSAPCRASKRHIGGGSGAEGGRGCADVSLLICRHATALFRTVAAVAAPSKLCKVSLLFKETVSIDHNCLIVMVSLWILPHEAFPFFCGAAMPPEHEAGPCTSLQHNVCSG